MFIGNKHPREEEREREREREWMSATTGPTCRHVYAVSHDDHLCPCRTSLSLSLSIYIRTDLSQECSFGNESHASLCGRAGVVLCKFTPFYYSFIHP